jgi:hypothetical protein
MLFCFWYNLWFIQVAFQAGLVVNPINRHFISKKGEKSENENLCCDAAFGLFGGDVGLRSQKKPQRKISGTSGQNGYCPAGPESESVFAKDRNG